MSEVVGIKIKVDSDKAVKDVGKVNKGLQQTSKETKQVKTDTSEMGNQLDVATGGAVAGFKGMLGGLKSVTKGFRTLKGVLLTSGIGAIALAIGAVSQAFTDSEEGQNKFRKIMGVIGSVVGNLTDKLSDLGMIIIDTFLNPVESIKGLGNSIQEFVMDKIDQLLGGLGLVGTAIKKAFSGDFSGALTDAKDGFVQINKAINPVVIATDALVDGIKKTVNATKELTKEIGEDAKSAAKIADLRAKADIKERDLIVKRAEANRERAALLEKSVDKDRFTAAQRIEFLQAAADLEADITNQEIEAAKLRRDAKVLENTLSKSTKEDMLEEEEMKARLIDLETARLTKQKLVTAQITAAKKEEAAELKAIQTQAAADKKAIDDKAAAEEKIRKDQAAKDELQRKKDKEDADKRVAAEEQRQINLISAAKHSAADQAIALFGAETKAGKAAFLAKQVMNAMALVDEAKKTITMTTLKVAESNAAVAQGTAETGKVGFPQNIPLLIAYGLQAAGIIMAMKSAFGAAKSAASSAGVGGGAAPVSRPPEFNIVGASPVNQLAETIGEDNQRPIKAFVTSGDVTTAQSLERNIIENASIG